MVKKKVAPNFEKALEEFEMLVTRMEEGELSLEDSLKSYERGMALSRICQAALEEAEQRITLLNENSGELVDFEITTEDE